jgi:hypothetical protein
MNNNIGIKELYKMQFITKALDDGWSVRKESDIYIFVKKKEGLREVYNDNFIQNFVTNYG